MIKAIGNQLFWRCNNCDGDAETLVQMWKSLLFHITSEHEFATHFPKYPKCNHKQYSKEQSLKKKWMDKKSVADDCIEKIILDPKILKDMVHLVEPYHTGSREVFHFLINAYATNSQELDFNTMNTRVGIAVLDHNNNVGRKQDVIEKEGRGSWKKDDLK